MVGKVISSGIEISSLSIANGLDSLIILSSFFSKSRDTISLLDTGEAPIYKALLSKKVKSPNEVCKTSISSII